MSKKKSIRIATERVESTAERMKQAYKVWENEHWLLKQFRRDPDCPANVLKDYEYGAEKAYGEYIKAKVAHENARDQAMLQDTDRITR